MTLKKMNSSTKQLKLLNILVSLSIGTLGSYWAVVLFGSSNLNENDKDIISILIAILVAIATVVILCLLIYSTVKLYNGLYAKQVQKIATFLLIVSLVVSDLFVVRFFMELSVVSKIIFIYLHAIIMLHAVYSFKKVSG